MKILVKIGSALISQNNRINYRFLRQKVAEMAQLQRAGHRLILVSSGAVAAGMEVRDIKERPEETLQLQMLSGIGQVKLLKYYKEYFKEENLFTAQALITHHNFSTPGEVQTLSSVLNAYLDEGVIPIVNENDLVDKTELEKSPVFSDNDILSALVASKLGVDLALILTDVDGLYADNPKKNLDAEFYHEVESITVEIRKMADSGKSDLGLGGMLSKVRAAEMITDHGIPAIVGNGNCSIPALIDGSERRTLFKATDEAHARLERLFETF